MNHLHDLTVLVLGLGESGLAMARWCARHGATRARLGLARAAAAARRRWRAQVPQAQLVTGALGAERARRRAAGAEEPGPGAARRAHRAAARRGAPTRRRRCRRARAVRARAGRPGGRAGYAPKVVADHRHQRQDHDHGADGAAVERGGRRVASRRQHRPDDAATRWPTRSTPSPSESMPRPPARGLGARAVELPARRRHAGLRADAAAACSTSARTTSTGTAHGRLRRARRRASSAARATHGRQSRRPAVAARMVPPPTARCQAARKGRAPRVAAAQASCSFGLERARSVAGDFGLVVENGMAWLVRALDADETLRARRRPTPRSCTCSA